MDICSGNCSAKAHELPRGKVNGSHKLSPFQSIYLSYLNVYTLHNYHHIHIHIIVVNTQSLWHKEHLKKALFTYTQNTQNVMQFFENVVMWLQLYTISSVQENIFPSRLVHFSLALKQYLDCSSCLVEGQYQDCFA